MSKVVTCNGVHKTYPGGTEALRGVDLSLQAGHVYGLVGRNGAGKTTLLHILMAMLHASEGEVRIFGEDLWTHEDLKMRIGFASENQVLPGMLFIDDMLCFLEAVHPSWDIAMAEDIMGQFGLSRKDRIGTLSKGQQRQVQLLCSLCSRPDLLILDEPASGLDPVARRDFLSACLSMLNAEECTIIFSSHTFSDVERVASDVIVLHEGKCLLQHPLDELKEHTSLVELPVSSLQTALTANGIPAIATSDGSPAAGVFDAPPDQCRRHLTTVLGEDAMQFVTIRQTSLEDMFIALTRNSAQPEG